METTKRERALLGYLGAQHGGLDVHDGNLGLSALRLRQILPASAGHAVGSCYLPAGLLPRNLKLSYHNG